MAIIASSIKKDVLLLFDLGRRPWILVISMVSNRLLSLGFEVWCGVIRVLVEQVPVRSRGSGVLELLGLVAGP